MATPTESSLAELRKKESKPVLGWFQKHFPWFFNLKSVFWFFIFILVLGCFWMFYSLIWNSGTQLYGWDYSSQFTQFGYNFWDCWHTFFKTGTFVFYNAETFLGADNIGSNAYYGLFDPFVFIVNFFPREAVPQVYAFAACLKGAVGALMMRAYLRYMKVSEGASRVGATAFAYCGFFNFMEGFPNVTSICFAAPLILLGIEKVIRERKPGNLVWGLAILGIISFFYLVVMCIFGVIYALWRYFWTIKSRNASQNWGTIFLGIGSFAVGIMLSAWVLLPSIRQSSLSGRTASIGTFYLEALKSALSSGDAGSFFHLIFEEVGDNPGRELMGLISFFFPTVNYLYLPVSYTSSYDSWTASIFCYTPMIIFFIYSYIGVIRKKDWEHIIALPLCCYLLFTTFAYYFFYAFSGDGYGRWFIVLVPLIIRQACRGIDEVKESPHWQFPLASLLALFLTILTYVLASTLLDGKSFTNSNGHTYWVYSYIVPSFTNSLASKSLIWVIVYQVVLLLLECIVIYFVQHKKNFHQILIAFISIETIVCGNLSFVYGSSYSYNCDYNGGYNSDYCVYTDGVTYQPTALNLQDAINKANEDDPNDFFRLYQEGSYEKNLSSAMNYNGSSTFHSLYNFDVEDLGHYSHIVKNDSYHSTKSFGQTASNKVWSGYYANKRAAFDLTTGYKYYVIKNEGYGSDYWNDDSILYNVPFGSEVIYKNSQFKVYRSPYYNALGHAVDNVYQAVSVEDNVTPNLSNLYSGSSIGWSNSFHEIIRNEQLYLSGAILNEKATIPEGVTIQDVPSKSDVPAGFTDLSSSIYGYVYSNPSGYGYHAENPASFLSDETPVSGPIASSVLAGTSYQNDDGKLVWTSNAYSGYFNEDSNGAYFLLGYPTSNVSRIYMIGDTFDQNGTRTGTNVLLNYEYWAMQNLYSTDSSDLRTSYSGLYGFYAPGKVKYIVYCSKGSSSGSTTALQPFLYKQEKSTFDAVYTGLNDSEHGLSDVKYTSTNSFTFSTNYSSRKFVVTSLGYDAGWSVKATQIGESGQKVSVDCPTYRLDGGLVGFYAPKGETTYELNYVTPYFNTGMIFAYVGLFLFFSFEVLTFIYGVKKKRKELNLDWDGNVHEEKEETHSYVYVPKGFNAPVEPKPEEEKEAPSKDAKKPGLFKRWKLKSSKKERTHDS